MVKRWLFLRAMHYKHWLLSNNGLTDTSPEERNKTDSASLGRVRCRGMVGGQVLDIEGEKKELTLPQLESVHLNKTGAFLSFCIEAGAILASLETKKSYKVKKFAKHIGIAFQIQDDILDVTSTTEELGKTVGSDETSHKTTYPSLLGLEGAREQLHITIRLAKKSLIFFRK